MGIPFYFGEIIAKYPQDTHKLIIDECPKDCDRFFLDFNSIIHPCSAKVISKLQKKDENLHRIIFEYIADYTMQLIQIVSPKKLLYIAIDGVAPMAKIHQQRKRRYLSAQRNQAVNEFKNKHGIQYIEWDSNCITPGTQFMNELDDFLKTEFIERVKNVWKNFKIIVSGSDERGEGEHKMIHYIKNNSHSTMKYTDVIYGLDADLIMLSLTSHHANIVLMRETQDFGHLTQGSKIKVPFKYLLINKLRNIICEVLTTDTKEVNDNAVIDEYVFICILLGNDFVPALSFLKIKEGAIDILIKMYKNVKSATTANILNNKKINLEVLRLFMSYLYKSENELMQNIVEHYYNASPKYNCKKYIIARNNSRDVQEQIKDFLNYYEEYPLRNKPIFCQDINPMLDAKWRSIYYHHLFGGNSPHIIKQACEEYITGLEWIVNYYFDTDITNINNIWFYHYSYAPTTYDIYKYLHTLDTDFVKFLDKNQCNYAIEPYIQLLLVLPPQSINLLSDNLKSIMTDIKLGCVHLYPHKFQVETYLKSKLWECTPNLPIIDLHKIISTYNNITM